MGNDFELKIGMTVRQVMSNISKLNATDKTKQMIINFCNNDKDKKISNEIELTMLDSWASGSEKVKMPTTDMKKPISREKALKRGCVLGKDGDVRSFYLGSGGGVFGKLTEGSITTVYSSRYPNTTDTFISDELKDIDGDGFADIRHTRAMRELDDNTDYHQVETSYYDNNVDGEYDKKYVYDFKVNNCIETTVTTLTDLHTNEVNTSTSKYNMRTGEEID